MKNTKKKVTGSTAGRFAGVIGAQYHKLFKALPHLLDVEKEIAKEVRNGVIGSSSTPTRILDLGCGTGSTTLAICDVITNAAIVGIDVEPVMFQQYKQMIREQKGALHKRGIEVTACGMGALEYLNQCDAGSFDIVVSGFVLHNLSKADRHQILNQIGCVLSPQGRFINGDKIARRNKKLHNIDLMDRVASYVKTYNTGPDVAYGLGWIKHDLEDDGEDRKYTEKEFLASLRAAGFSRTRIVKRMALDVIAVADRIRR